MTCYQNEGLLDNAMILFKDHIVLMDGIPRRCSITGTVEKIKQLTGCKVIQRCDIIGRELTTKAVPYCTIED